MGRHSLQRKCVYFWSSHLLLLHAHYRRYCILWLRLDSESNVIILQRLGSVSTLLSRLYDIDSLTCQLVLKDKCPKTHTSAKNMMRKSAKSSKILRLLSELTSAFWTYHTISISMTRRAVEILTRFCHKETSERLPDVALAIKWKLPAVVAWTSLVLLYCNSSHTYIKCLDRNICSRLLQHLDWLRMVHRKNID